MPYFQIEFLADGDYNSTNVISSVIFECKSITTAVKMIYDFFPENFHSFKLYNYGKCRVFLSKEIYLKNRNLK
jgi:hypothetical protein